MIKKNVIIVIILVLAIVCGYYVFNLMFPIAKTIQYPLIEDVTSIKISPDNNNEGKKILGTDFVKVINHISNSKPTRIKSINDIPSVRPYYKIELLTEENIFTYYIYKDNKKVYIERPYEGIYTINNKIINIISD